MQRAKRTWLRRQVSQLMLLSVLFVANQAAIASETRPMAFRHLTVADGLSQSTVMDIHQDSRGYIWLATENGLDRYDGYAVHRYQSGSAVNGELANDYIWQIAEDDSGDLWLATNGAGIAHWQSQTDRFTHYRHDAEDPNSLSGDHVRSVLLTEDGIWAGTQQSGLNFIDRKSGRVIRYRHDTSDPTSLPHDGVFALVEDRSGRIWVGTDNGLAWTEPGSSRFTRLQHDAEDVNSLSHNRVISLYVDSLGTLWVGTFGGGLNAMNPRSTRFTRYPADPDHTGSLSNGTVWDVLEDDNGHLWVATADGLNLLMPTTDSFTQYVGGERDDQLSDGYIMSLHQDRRGVLWVGTRFGGVNTWNSNSWQLGHQLAPGLHDYSVTSFETDRDGFWVGTFGGGLVYTNDVTGSVTNLSTGTTPALTDDRVMSLLHDRHGTLWIGTMGGGINRLSTDREKITVLRHDQADSTSLPVDGAMSLYEDTAGMIWIGTFGKGVVRYDPISGDALHYLPDPADPSSLCGSQGRAFAEDAGGSLWIGTENGLCRFKPTEAGFQSYRNNEDSAGNLADNSVYALYTDPDGTLWVGTGGGGLNRITLNPAMSGGVRFETISRRDGLSSNMIYAIQPDADGSLWLSGNNGLTRYSPDSREVRTYRRSQGLQGNEFHYGASHRSAIGTLFFGGANGFNRFDPTRLEYGSEPPPVVLTGISTMNRPLESAPINAASNVIKLDHRSPAITFEFAALDYTDPESNRYAYRLQGFDEDWVEAGTRRTASYANLRGGQYRFEVRAAGSSGSRTNTGLAISIQVEPTPWTTLWAFLAYGLILVTVIWLYVRRNRRQLAREAEYSRRLETKVKERTEELEVRNDELKQLTQVKSEFLARMSHEIRSPINGILGMTELLNRSQLDLQQKKYARTIASSGESLLHVINDILDFSKLEAEMVELDVEETDLEQLLSDTVDMFALQAANKGLDLILRLPSSGLPAVRVDGLRLKQVLVNLLTNAVKFTERGHVVLEVECDTRRSDRLDLSFSVVDTGIGIATENQARIFESFSQEDASTTRRFGGTGLGLAICRELLTLMNSSLRLNSEPGKGATFSFDLSLDRGSSEAADDEVAFIGGALIVCQRPTLASLLVHYLSDWGLHTRVAASAVAALDSLTRPTGRSFDLVIVDDQLSDFSALDLLRSMQAQDLANKQRCIMLHSIDTPSDRKGEAHPVSKPVKRRDLLLTIAATQNLDVGILPVNEDSSDQPLVGHVLIVEDNVVNQEVFSGMLTEIGCTSSCAQDGQTGLLMASSEDFDAILMDYELPDINGADVAKQIRLLDSERARTPIIALTANTTADDEATCLAAGMDAFLAKPCSLGNLTRTLARWLPVVEAASSTGSAERESGDAKNPGGQFDELALGRIRRLRHPDGSSILEHAVTLFLNTASATVAALKEAAAADDAESLRFNAHKLKSGCANLGAASMADLCRQVEERARSGSLGGMEILIARVESELTLVIDWLEEQLRESA